MSRLSSAQSIIAQQACFHPPFCWMARLRTIQRGSSFRMADSVDCLPSNSQEPYELEVRLGQLTQRLHSHQQQYLAIEDH